MTARRSLGAALVLAFAWTTDAVAAKSVDLAAMVAGWPGRYRVSGIKNEPTYRAAIEIVRDGDVFSVTGGAPAWAPRSTESIAVAADGSLSHTVCPAGMDCAAAPHPGGFLATAALLGAWRTGTLHGRAVLRHYAGRAVVCVPGELIGIAAPILDPCFDRRSGAAIAQRHRLSGRFEGPTLEAATLRIDLTQPVTTRSVR